MHKLLKNEDADIFNNSPTAGGVATDSSVVLSVGERAVEVATESRDVVGL